MTNHGPPLIDTPSQVDPKTTAVVTPLRILYAALVLLCGAPFAVLAATPAAAAGHAVDMAHYAFSPATLTVSAGETVTWTNHDQAPHDVTTTSAPVAIKSPTLSTGQSFTYTFTTPGTYSYYCSIHPDMQARIVVQPAAATAAPAPAGAPPRQPTRQSRPSAPRQAVGPPAAQPGQAMPMPPSEPGTAPPADQASAATPSTQAAQPTAQVSTLDPLLLITGLVAGIATLCLLLIGSRPPEQASPSAGNRS